MSKKPQVEVPVVEPGATTTKETSVITPEKGFIPKQMSGLSPDAKVTLFATYHDRYSKNVPDDLKDSPEFLKGMNTITDALGVAIFAEEAVNNDTTVHRIIERSPKLFNALAVVAKEYGVELPDLNLLPAPTKKQLEAAGMADADPAQKAVVTIDKNVISKEAKKQIQEEKKVADSKPADSPTDVENEQQLKASLMNIFIKGDRPVARAKKAINFYRAYLKLQNKDDQTKLDEIEKMTDTELLSEVKSIIGQCPYKDKGIAGFLRKAVAKSGTPIEAFCTLYKSARDKKTGEMEATDELLAAICRTYVIWSCESVIDEANAVIESENRQLKKLDENNPKHKDGIATITKNIEDKNADIEYAKAIIAAVISPDMDLIAGLIDAYNADDNENHNIAVSIVSAVLETMYPNVDMTKYEAGCVENNAKQYAGIIMNLFCDPASRISSYTYGNVVELTEVEKSQDEDKPAKGEAADEKK